MLLFLAMIQCNENICYDLCRKTLLTYRSCLALISTKELREEYIAYCNVIVVIAFAR